MLRDCRSVSAQRMLPGHCKSDKQAVLYYINPNLPYKHREMHGFHPFPPVSRMP